MKGMKGVKNTKDREYLPSWLPGVPRELIPQALSRGERGNPGSQEGEASLGWIPEEGARMEGEGLAQSRQERQELHRNDPSPDCCDGVAGGAPGDRAIGNTAMTTLLLPTQTRLPSPILSSPAG